MHPALLFCKHGHFSLFDTEHPWNRRKVATCTMEMGTLDRVRDPKSILTAKDLGPEVQMVRDCPENFSGGLG